MIGYRIKYKNIISELYIPENSNGKTIIFLPGLPSFLGKNDLTKKLVKTGFTVYQPYYSGSFDSSGEFSPSNCVKDITTFIKMSKQKKQTELYFNKTLNVINKEIILFGISYGSSIASFACNNLEISKIVLFCPVLTYSQKIIDECCENLDFSVQMKGLYNLLRNGYPLTYRIKNLPTLRTFLLGEKEIDNPIQYLSKNQTVPMIIFQGSNDFISPKLTQNLIKKYEISKKDCKLFTVKNAGHGVSYFAGDSVINKLLKFL